MVENRREKKEARALAAKLGIRYTAALRMLRERKAAAEAEQDKKTED